MKLGLLPPGRTLATQSLKEYRETASGPQSSCKASRSPLLP